MSNSANSGSSDTVGILHHLTEASDVNPNRRGVIRPVHAELSGVERHPREEHTPGQDYFDNPEDYDPDPELTERQNKVKAAMGIIAPDDWLSKLLIAQRVNGIGRVEFKSGLYVLDHGDEMQFNINLRSHGTDVTTKMIVEKAIKKGWKSIEFDGEPAVGDALWLECQRRGMPLKGHVPTANALRMAASDPVIQSRSEAVDNEVDGPERSRGLMI